MFYTQTGEEGDWGGGHYMFYTQTGVRRETGVVATSCSTHKQV